MPLAMWLPIVRSAKQYLESLPELAGYEIAYLGTPPVDPGASRLDIDFDSESDAIDKATPTPEVSLYLRLKVRMDDETPDRAMAESYRIHNAILAGQRRWQAKMVATLGVATQVRAAAIGCLGTAMRPYYTTELALILAWRSR